jgi:hypothetical protein
LFDAIRMHLQLAQTLTMPNLSFLLWLSAKYPGVSLLPDSLVDTKALSELRRIFPALGSSSVQKRTFRKGLKLGASSD